MGDGRRPRSVFGVGDEPDPRFSLANERTALAWVRTGLALIAGGIGLTSLVVVARLPRWLDAVAALMCLGGGVLALRANTGWRASERALRLRQPLPAPRALTWLTAAVAALALVLASYAAARVFAS